MDANPTAHDLYLFHEGTLYHSYRMMGAHPGTENGAAGVRFTLWAPHAESVGVAGDFNAWDGRRHPMRRISEAGVWRVFIPGIKPGDLYKFDLRDQAGGRRLKSDPFAFRAELRPGTASMVYGLEGFDWQDRSWYETKKRLSSYERPMLTYELHAGSWRTHSDGSYLNFRELADQLIPYLKARGFTHVELMPVAEYPYDRSWGYQITGYYAVTRRYGTPGDLKAFVNACHQAGIGVILDWVPGHFCKDDHGLRQFDGAPLFEYADPKKAEKPLWGTLSFDYGKPEVRSFLISNAIYWMEVFHIDGLRVDAVAGMLDYNFDKPREMWVSGPDGKSENPEAVDFLRKLNEAVFRYFPEALMIAEDSSAYPLVTAPTYDGGLGFNYKWNMGWMNDVLRVMQSEPRHRHALHRQLTFSFMYSHAENFILPFSHDEVVHGKRSLLHKMPGAYEDKFANLRLLLAYMIAHPGKKLLFMGTEYGQFDEWKDDRELDWMLLDYASHREMERFAGKLFKLYRDEPALWELDFSPDGLEWIDPDNAGQGVVSFIRKGKSEQARIVAVFNYSEQAYSHFRIGVPAAGEYRMLMNSREEPDDCKIGEHEAQEVMADELPYHRQPCSMVLTVPPLSAQFWKPCSMPIPECNEIGGGLE